MNEWKQTTLGKESIKIGSGATPKGGSNSYKEAGISLIRSQNILDFKFSTDGLAYIDDDQADNLQNVTVEENDVLLNITGDSVARCCIVPTSVLPARVNQHVSIVRLNSEKASHSFIFYLLQSMKEELLMQSEIGATRRALTKGMLESLEIVLPPLPEQKAIASVLSSLDDKIDLLHRQNKTLEAIAETLFRQWFIEEAQEDWKEGKLGDLVNFNYGKTLRDHERSGSGYPVIGSSGIVGFHKDFLVEAPGIVTGRKGTLGVTNYLFDNFFPIDTTFYITSKTESEGLFYEYFLLKSVGLGEMNSDSAVPGLNRNAAHEIPVIVPPDEWVRKFNNQCKFNFLKLKTNQNQIKTLEKLRDTLLPKFMSGEVRVSY